MTLGLDDGGRGGGGGSDGEWLRLRLQVGRRWRIGWSDDMVFGVSFDYWKKVFLKRIGFINGCRE